MDSATGFTAFCSAIGFAVVFVCPVVPEGGAMSGLNRLIASNEEKRNFMTRLQRCRRGGRTVCERSLRGK